MTKEHMLSYVDDRPAENVFRVRRDIFTDPDLFQLEMKRVFGGTWVFIGLEAQIPKPNDYFSHWIGLTPVLVIRDANGTVGAYFNACPHKGTLLVHKEHGNAKNHVCAYHGWSFDSSGKNINIKDKETVSYPPAFDRESHDLKPIARVATYGGLIFGSLSDQVHPIEDYLGDLRTFIDLAMEQGPQGMEIVPGRAVYTYRGNWKLQMDNGMDAYHLTSTHSAFMDVMIKRAAGDGYLTARQYDWQTRFSQKMGILTFPYGHAVNWMNLAEPEKRPIFPVIDEIRARVGEMKAKWMLKGRSVTLFPNVQIADQTSLLLRTFRPISVDLTEMKVFCIAPIGEAPDRRAWRLRQFEDFFNATGLATPDDATVYEDVQRGCVADSATYLQGYYRGLGNLGTGPDDIADELGIHPVASQYGNFDAYYETGLHSQYREWLRLMRNDHQHGSKKQ